MGVFVGGLAASAVEILPILKAKSSRRAAARPITRRVDRDMYLPPVFFSKGAFLT